jgi:hypothetical protein
LYENVFSVRTPAKYYDVATVIATARSQDYAFGISFVKDCNQRLEQSPRKTQRSSKIEWGMRHGRGRGSEDTRNKFRIRDGLGRNQTERTLESALLLNQTMQHIIERPPLWIWMAGGWQIHCHCASLADSISAICGLVFLRRIPVTLKVNDVISRDDV